MRYYPMFVSLAGKRCLVVGAGQVGRRKIASLASCGPEEVLVLDVSDPGEEFAGLAKHPAVRFEQRGFADTDLDGRSVVIASTSNEELNWRISNLCRERGILCNIVDQPEKCGFIVPALFTRGDLTVAISTGGSSPALARKIRQDMEEFFGSGYGAFLLLMSRIRPLILALGKGSDANSLIFRSLVGSSLLESLENKDMDQVREVLLRELPKALHPQVEGLLDGLT